MAADERVAPAAIQLNLTAAGWSVLALSVAAVFLSATRQLAIGFMIPLAAAVVIDVFLSWNVVSRRQVSITPTRTVVYSPDGIPLRIDSRGPGGPARLTVTFRGADEQVITLGEDVDTLELQAMQTGIVNYVRCNVSCTLFGLGSAGRWQTHSLPIVHWAPAPDPAGVTTPEAVDEVARLREYVPGDRMSRVSWPITAATGRMHVRDTGAGYEEFVVVVNTPEAELIEETLELASTLLTQLIQDGHQVRLVTTELDAEVLNALRQSAIDNPRLPAVLGSDVPRTLRVVDHYLIDEDDLARRLAKADVAPSVTWSYGNYVEVSSLGIRTLP